MIFQAERKTLRVEILYPENKKTVIAVGQSRKGEPEPARPQYVGGRPSPGEQIEKVMLILETRRRDGQSTLDWVVDAPTWGLLNRLRMTDRVYRAMFQARPLEPIVQEALAQPLPESSAETPKASRPRP